MAIDIKTAAYMLKTSEEMLLRWVRQGAIPVIESSTEVFFRENELLKWAEKRHMPIRRQDTAVNEESELSLVSAVMKGGVHLHVPGTSVSEVLLAAVERIETPLPIDKADLHQRLIAREASASTGIGGGIAIPHPGRPVTGVPESGVAAFCFLETPVDFRAVDQQPVFVLALLISPSAKRHLTLLSKLAFCLGHPAVSGMLTNLPAYESLISALMQAENETGSSAP